MNFLHANYVQAGEPSHRLSTQVDSKQSFPQSDGRSSVARFNRCHFSNKKQMLQSSANQPQLKYHLQNSFKHRKATDSSRYRFNLKNFQPSKGNSRNATKMQKKSFVKLSLEAEHHEVEVPYQIEGEVKQVNSHIKILKDMGFSEKNLTKWMLIFLNTKSPFLKSAFLKSHQNKKSLVDSYIFQRETNPENTLQKFRRQLPKINHSELIFLVNELKDLKKHLQEIIVKKTEANLQQITLSTTNSVNKSSAKLQVPKYPSSQIMHFIKDLNSMEDRYGELPYISRLNRMKFNKIQEAELKIVEGYRCALRNDKYEDFSAFV